MEIEKIKFTENGYNYTLKEVKNLRPESNVSGFVRIENKYYEKIYDFRR